MPIKILLLLTFIVSLNANYTRSKEAFKNQTTQEIQLLSIIQDSKNLDSTHKASREFQLERIRSIIKNTASSFRNNKVAQKNIARMEIAKNDKQNTIIPNIAYVKDGFLSLQPIKWKDNAPVLQNPDSIFNTPDISNMLDENAIKEPFAPPFKYIPYYGLGSYLEPSGILPNIIPPSIAIPPMILEKVKPYQKDFIISYQFLLKNEMPIGEKFSISEPMVNRQMSVSYECKIDSAINEDFDDDSVLGILLKLLLEYHKDEVLECLYKTGILLREDGISEKNRSNNKILFSLPPTYVRTSLENGFLKILVLEKH